MQSLFRSYEQFKSATTDIAKHLSGTKLAVLREAVAKAHGFKNVSSYEASFASKSSSTIPVDPNIICDQREGLVVFQGRLEGLVNLNDDPEYAEAAQRVSVSVSQWRSQGMSERLQWEDDLRTVWGVTLGKVGLLEIDGRVYARTVVAEMHADSEELSEDFARFLSHQPALSKTQWVYWAVATFTLDLVLHDPVGNFVDSYVGKLVKRYNTDTWDAGLRVSDYLPYSPFEGVLFNMNTLAGALGWSKELGADTEAWQAVLVDAFPREYLDFTAAKLLWFNDGIGQQAWERDWQELDEVLPMHATGLMILLAEETLTLDATWGLREAEMTGERLRACASKPMMRFQMMADLMVMRWTRY